MLKDICDIEPLCHTIRKKINITNWNTPLFHLLLKNNVKSYLSIKCTGDFQNFE